MKTVFCNSIGRWGAELELNLELSLYPSNGKLKKITKVHFQTSEWKLWDFSQIKDKIPHKELNWLEINRINWDRKVKAVNANQVIRVQTSALSIINFSLRDGANETLASNL